MSEKAKRGGTLRRAPIVHTNTLQRRDGHDSRSVQIDPIRGPLIHRTSEISEISEISDQRRTVLNANGNSFRSVRLIQGGNVESVLVRHEAKADLSAVRRPLPPVDLHKGRTQQITVLKDPKPKQIVIANALVDQST